METNRKSNGYAVAGFLFSNLALVLSFVRMNSTVIDGGEGAVWAMWCLAAVLSTIGMFRRPRLLAIIGLIICIVVVSVYYILAAIAA